LNDLFHALVITRLETLIYVFFMSFKGGNDE